MLEATVGIYLYGGKSIPRKGVGAHAIYDFPFINHTDMFTMG